MGFFQQPAHLAAGASLPGGGGVLVLSLVLALGVLHWHRARRGAGASRMPAPEAEFHMARMIYSSGGGFGAFGPFGRPWWAIDYPEAEYHFRKACGG